jgi:hypothetical protein
VLYSNFFICLYVNANAYIEGEHKNKQLPDMTMTCMYRRMAAQK